MAELRDPKEFPKALALLQSIDISLYIIVAVVIYYYAGADVTSPALGSAGSTISKVAYGIALPTVRRPPIRLDSRKLIKHVKIVIAGVLNGHIAAKQIYVRIFGGTPRIHKRDWIATGSWIAIVVAIWVLAWIIGEAIPIFGNLLGLIVSGNLSRRFNQDNISHPSSATTGITIFKLVLVWSTRHILVIYEQGPLVLVTKENSLNGSQLDERRCWPHFGK